MAVVKRPVATINFYKKLCLPIITWNKKYLSKQVLPITCNMEKCFLQLLLHVKACESFLFRQSTKTFLARSKEVNLFFYMQMSNLICQSIKLRKLAVQNACCVFVHFCGGRKNSFHYNFISPVNNPITILGEKLF